MIASVWEHNEYFGESKHVLDPRDVDERFKLLIFWGGADVSPHLYQERNNGRSYTDYDRDKLEVAIFRRAKELKIPMLGICRGSQFLCVMNGGRLWQHVMNHGRSHYVTTSKNESFVVTSTHHQMMRPVNGELLAWSAKPLSPLKEDQLSLVSDSSDEPEVVYWKDTNTLGVQGHPEYLPKDSQFSQYVFNLIKEKLNVDL